MFCKNCGKELTDGAVFCSACGMKQSKIPDESNRQDTDVNVGKKESNLETKVVNPDSDKKKLTSSIIVRIWNSVLFTKIAIKFGNILEILEGVIFLILSRFLFKEGGFWGIGLGIFFGLAGLIVCLGSIISLLSRRKNQDGAETFDETDIRKKKRNLCIGIPVIIIAMIIVVNTGGGTYAIVKSISFDDMGSETIGELVDKNIKGPEWSKVKLDSGSELVYVEGYCPEYGETILIEFYYEKSGDSHEVSLKGMYWPDSDEEFNTLEASIVWASFYD